MKKIKLPKEEIKFHLFLHILIAVFVTIASYVHLPFGRLKGNFVYFAHFLLLHFSLFGFIYFFGDSAKKAVRSTPAKPAAVAPVAVKPMDSDNDGVVDSKDQCKATPVANKVDVNGCTIFTEQQETINLLVSFENNKSDVADMYLTEIAKVAKFMKQYPHTQLTINGHTSVVGEAAYNQNLSEKRAQAIVDVLVNNFSISQNRLTAVGHGEEQLVNEANTAAAHAQNRRIQAQVQTTKKVAIKR